jgi:hypothetical protein
MTLVLGLRADKRGNNVSNGHANHQVGFVSRATDWLNVLAFRGELRTNVGFRDLSGRHNARTAGGLFEAILIGRRIGFDRRNFQSTLARG